MTDHAIVNGIMTPLSEARISVLDLGFLRGLAVFETLRTYGGHPHALAEHHQRLAGGAAAMGFACPLDQAALRRHIAAARAAASAQELRVNLVVTAGNQQDGLFDAGEPNWVIIARHLVPPPRRWYDDGCRAVTFCGARLHPEIKTTSYLSGRTGLAAAEAAGAIEALYVDEQGCITEGVTSNVMALRGSTVFSPPQAALDGITRRHLAVLAAGIGLDWQRADLRIEDLADYDELWISSSVRELVPIIQVDDQIIGSGRPGPWAQRLSQLYHQTCLDEAQADAAASKDAD